ncbi:STAS domain-containing protein [Fictibacillus iocasae]|uniref:STAS domain-containing protein n=1 Tax=Fictibacillus iocasae TaxID=2715437 RepID=A0ABW2NRC0_9BACL
MLTYTTTFQKDVIQVTFQGDIDSESTDIFQEELAALFLLEAESVVIELEDVGFVDSTGIGFILGFIETLKTAGKKAVMASITEDVYEIFQLLQIEEIIGDEVFEGIRIV